MSAESSVGFDGQVLKPCFGNCWWKSIFLVYGSAFFYKYLFLEISLKRVQKLDCLVNKLPL